MEAVDAGRVEQRLDVVGHALDRVRPAVLRSTGAPVSAVIHRQHAMVRGQVRDLVAPVGDVAGVAVHEHHGIAAASVQLVVHLEAVDRRVGH